MSRAANWVDETTLPTKKCNGCLWHKPIEEFRTFKRDGRLALKHLCIPCERFTERQNPRGGKTHGKKVYDPKSPKTLAHRAVSSAIRAGTLLKQPCEVCGHKAQAHHDDYSKPLEVRWLCPKHHRQHHWIPLDAGLADAIRRGE